MTSRIVTYTMSFFMSGYQRFAILFYIYLFIKNGNAPVLSGTPGSWSVVNTAEMS